jgi:hypothetical protein
MYKCEICGKQVAKGTKCEYITQYKDKLYHNNTKRPERKTTTGREIIKQTRVCAECITPDAAL